MPRSSFTDRQRRQLLVGIPQYRVYDRDGNSYLPAWDVIAHLNRMFGFEGWEKEILSLEEVTTYAYDKTKNGKTFKAFDSVYRCLLRLTVYDENGEVVKRAEDASTGDATGQRSVAAAHDLAMKSAISTALKRAAKDLGDQFGLSLYNGGQTTALVGSVLPYLPDDPDAEIAPEHEIRSDGVDETTPQASEDLPDVREPKPARSGQPAATPPADRPADQYDPVSPATIANWHERIASPQATTDLLRAVWDEIKAARLLDYVVEVDDRKVTLRDLIVARQQEIERAAEGAA